MKKDDPDTLRRAALTIHEKYGKSQQHAVNELLDLATEIDGKGSYLPEYYYSALANTGADA
jgi:hypothetical protein